MTFNEKYDKITTMMNRVLILFQLSDSIYVGE